jgi:hypothetical protein
MPTKQVLELLRQARAQGVCIREDRERQALLLWSMKKPSSMLLTILDAHKWELILYLRDLDERKERFMARLRKGVESK